MSGRQGWPNGYYQPGASVQDVHGALHAARQQKRSQQQAAYHQGQEQNANWFKEKPANKSARLDIVTHHQQGAVQGAAGSQYAQHGTAQAGGNSVSVELMTKMQRQKEAKEQAEMQKELAERRRREARLAVERADEEYRRACEAERQATEAASGTTSHGVNPPPPPPEPEARAQAAEPSNTPQKAASAAKPALDVSQDEILLSWLNHGDNLKQQWAIWYMHNPEEWIEYKASHQKQTGGNTAANAAASASAAASAAPAASTADNAADASKTAAAAATTASQQNTYSQPNAQADTGAEAQRGAASNPGATQSSTDTAAAAAAAAVAAAGAQHMAAGYARPPPGQAWPGWPPWVPPGSPYGAVPYGQYPGPGPYPNYFGVPPYPGGPMMPYGQRPPQNYMYPRMPGPQGPMPMYGAGGPGPPPGGGPAPYPPQGGAAGPQAPGASKPRPAAPKGTTSSAPGGASRPQSSLNGGGSTGTGGGTGGGGGTSPGNTNAGTGSGQGAAHAKKKQHEQKSAAASSRPPESQQQSYATQSTQPAANAPSQHAEHSHPSQQQPQHMPQQQQQYPHAQQQPQPQQESAPAPSASAPQQLQPSHDSRPYQQYRPQPSAQSQARDDPQYAAQPPPQPSHSQHSQQQQQQQPASHQASHMQDSQPPNTHAHGGPHTTGVSPAAAAPQWSGGGPHTQAASGYPPHRSDAASQQPGTTHSTQGVQAPPQHAGQVGGAGQPPQYLAGGSGGGGGAPGDDPRLPPWAQHQQQQQQSHSAPSQSAPAPHAHAHAPAAPQSFSQHGFPPSHSAAAHGHVSSGTAPGSQDAPRSATHQRGLYSSRKGAPAHGEGMQQQQQNHSQQQQQETPHFTEHQQPVQGQQPPQQQQQQASSFPMQHQQHPQHQYASQQQPQPQQYARQGQQERPPASFPTQHTAPAAMSTSGDNRALPNPPPNPSSNPDSRTAAYPESNEHYERYNGHRGAPPPQHHHQQQQQQHTATPGSDSYASNRSYGSAQHGASNGGPPSWPPDSQPQPAIQNSNNSSNPLQPPQAPSAVSGSQPAYHQPPASNAGGTQHPSASGGAQMSEDPPHMQHQYGSQYWQQQQQPDSFPRGSEQSMAAQPQESGRGGPPWGPVSPADTPGRHAHSAAAAPLYRRQGQVQGPGQGMSQADGASGIDMEAPLNGGAHPQGVPAPHVRSEPAASSRSFPGAQQSKAAADSTAQFSSGEHYSNLNQHGGSKYPEPSNERDMLMSGGGAGGGGSGGGGGSMWAQDQNAQASQRGGLVQAQGQTELPAQAPPQRPGGMAASLQAQNQDPTLAGASAPPPWQSPPQPPTAGPKPGYLHMQQRAASSPGSVRQTSGPHTQPAQAAPWMKVGDQTQNIRSEAGDARTYTGATKDQEPSQSRGPAKGYLASRSNSAPRKTSQAGGFLRNTNSASNRSQSADGRTPNAPNTLSNPQNRPNPGGGPAADRAPPTHGQGLYSSNNGGQRGSDLMRGGSDRDAIMLGSGGSMRTAPLPASVPPVPPAGGRPSTSAALPAMQPPHPPVCLPPALPAFVGVSAAEGRPAGSTSAGMRTGAASGGAAAQPLPLPRMSAAPEVAVPPASIGSHQQQQQQPSRPAPPEAAQDTATTPSWLASSGPRAELDSQRQLPQPQALSQPPNVPPSLSSLPPPTSSTQRPPSNSFQHSWMPQDAQPPNNSNSSTAVPSNSAASSLPRPMPALMSGGTSSTTPIPPPGSAGMPPVHMSAASHSKPSPPQPDASTPLPPPGMNSVLPSTNSANHPSPPGSARLDGLGGSNTGPSQDGSGGAKPRPGPRYDTHGMGMAPYMQQGVRGNSSSGSFLPGRAPPGGFTAPGGNNRTLDAAVPSGLPAPGTLQHSNQPPPPGPQTMSQGNIPNMNISPQGNSTINIPNMPRMQHQRDVAGGGVPAAPGAAMQSGNSLPRAAVQGSLPASQPLVNGKQGGMAAGLTMATPFERTGTIGAHLMQAGPQQQQQKFAAVPVPGPGPPRGGAVPPLAQTQGAAKHGGFLSRRSPSASGPMFTNPRPPAVQMIQAPQPVQNGMHGLPAVSQIRPAPPPPRGLHVQIGALQPWGSGAGRPQGQGAQNEMGLFRGPGVPVRPPVGAVPGVRPPAYR